MSPFLLIPSWVSLSILPFVAEILKRAVCTCFSWFCSFQDNNALLFCYAQEILFSRLALSCSSSWHNGPFPPGNTLLSWLWWPCFLQVFLRVSEYCCVLFGSSSASSVITQVLSQQTLKRLRLCTLSLGNLLSSLISAVPCAEDQTSRARNPHLSDSGIRVPFPHQNDSPWNDAFHRLVSHKQTFKFSESWPKQSFSHFRKKCIKKYLHFPDFIYTFY